MVSMMRRWLPKGYILNGFTELSVPHMSPEDGPALHISWFSGIVSNSLAAVMMHAIARNKSDFI